MYHVDFIEIHLYLLTQVSFHFFILTHKQDVNLFKKIMLTDLN